MIVSSNYIYVQHEVMPAISKRKAQLVLSQAKRWVKALQSIDPNARSVDRSLRATSTEAVTRCEPLDDDTSESRCCRTTLA